MYANGTGEGVAAFHPLRLLCGLYAIFKKIICNVNMEQCAANSRVIFYCRLTPPPHPKHTHFLIKLL